MTNKEAVTARKKANKKYEKNTRVQKKISLHRVNDADLIDYIERLPDFSNAVKDWLRKEIKRNSQ